MPISIGELQQPNQVFVVVSGETSMKEMMDFIVMSRTGPHRDFAFLFDVSAAVVTISGDEMRRLAEFAAEESRKAPMGPVAFISTDPGTFGVSRIFQSYSTAAGRKNVGVFHTMAEAQTWLAGLSS